MTRILIVDDAPTMRMYYRGILEPARFDIEEAMNGIEALEKAFTDSFDLFVVDVNMPKLDGLGFLRELRSSELPQTPAIVISTDSELRHREAAWRCGANVCLAKPVSPAQLLRLARLLTGALRP